LNPSATPELSHVEKCLQDTTGPIITATDYVRLFAEQIRPAIQHMGRRYEVLGTDGFGRSDTREKLRDFFEVDRRWIVLTALRSLVDSGQMDRQKLAEALKKYEIDTTKPNPMLV
jgi:pyruvate dehydrogenase E1 component